MDGNLLAGIFDSREQIEEWKKAPAIPTEPLTLVPDVPPVAPNAAPSVTTNAATPASGDQPQQQSPPPHPEISSGPPVVDHYMGDLFTVAVGAVVKKTDGKKMLSKSAHVEFGITVTRLSDGASRTIYRRFRDIKNFYYDLVGQFSEVEFNTHVKFPTYDSWLSSSASDPNSELVIRRKVDLQVCTG